MTAPRQSRRLLIEQALTGETEASIRQVLLAALAGCDELVVDLSRVESIDTVGFQLMLTVKMEAARLNKKIRFIEHSRAILGVLADLNEHSFLGDPLPTPPAGQVPGTSAPST